MRDIHRFERLLDHMVRWGRLGPESVEICREACRQDGPAVGFDRLLDACRLSEEEEAVARQALRETGAVAARSPLPEGQETIGEYRIVRLLGQGGMGRVLLAEDGSGRQVALKTIRDATSCERFLDEGRLIARLDHPNVIRIYDAGAVDGVPYLAMEYIEGGGLDAIVEREPVSPRRAAHLVRQAARGLFAAHEAGILHRDIKPSNLLVDREDRLRVVDFGLATEEVGSGGTKTGHLVGSVHFMSPEQAKGEWREVDVRSDVYGLGGVLYHALTRSPPHEGPTLLAIVSSILHGEIPPVRQRAGLIVPRDLEAITMKALESDPGRRYPSASAMADDLDRFLAGHPVVARPVPVWQRLARRGWKNRRIVIPALLVVGVGVAVLTGQVVRDVGRRSRAAQLVEEGDRRMASVDLGGARVAYSEAFALDPTGRCSDRVEVATTLEQVRSRLDEGGAREVPRARALLAAIGEPFPAVGPAVAALQASLEGAFLEIEIDIPGATLTLLGDPDRPLSTETLVLTAGSHRLALDRPDRPRWVLPIELAGRERLHLAFREHVFQPGDDTSKISQLPPGSIARLARGRHEGYIDVRGVKYVLLEGEGVEATSISSLSGGMTLADSEYVVVMGLRIQAGHFGLDLDSCRRILVEDVVIDASRDFGVRLLDRRDQEVNEQVIFRRVVAFNLGIHLTGFYYVDGALQFRSVEDVLIEECRFEGKGTGLRIEGGRGIGVRRCEFFARGTSTRQTPAVTVDRSESVDIDQIEAAGRHTLVRIDRSRRVTIRRSQLLDGDCGLSFRNVRELTILEADFRDLDIGIDGGSGYGVRLLSSRFARVGRGFDFDAVVMGLDGRAGNEIDERSGSRIGGFPFQREKWTGVRSSSRPPVPAWLPGAWVSCWE